MPGQRDPFIQVVGGRAGPTAERTVRGRFADISMPHAHAGDPRHRRNAVTEISTPENTRRRLQAQILTILSRMRCPPSTALPVSLMEESSDSSMSGELPSPLAVARTR